MTNLDASIPCPICGAALTLSPCRPSRAGKNSLHVRCPVEGRHLRGFITHQPLVDEVLDQVQKIASEGPALPEDSTVSDPEAHFPQESDVSQ
jgi:hypothetical protein